MDLMRNAISCVRIKMDFIRKGRRVEGEGWRFGQQMIKLKDTYA